MPRLIDADKLAKDINSLSTHPLNEWDTAGVLIQIDKQPTVDAVEVVRCYDCEHYRKVADEYFCLGKGHFDLPTEADGYCAWAKRREDGRR